MRSSKKSKQPKPKLFIRVVHYFARVLLGQIVVLGILGVALLGMFKEPATLKQFLNDSGAYDQVTRIIANELYSQIVTANTTQADSSSEAKAVTLSQDTLDTIAYTANTDEALNRIVDASYQWLRGDTKELQFTEQLFPNDTAFFLIVIEAFKARANALPACTESDTITVTSPLAMSCLPVDFDTDSIALFVTASKEVAPLSELYSSAALNSQQLPISNSITKQAQLAFSIFLYLPLICLLLLIPVVPLFIVTTQRGKRIRALGTTTIWIGISLLITGFLLKTQSARLSKEAVSYVPAEGINVELLDQITALFTILNQQLGNQIIVLSVVVLLIGVIISAIWLLRR